MGSVSAKKSSSTAPLKTPATQYITTTTTTQTVHPDGSVTTTTVTQSVPVDSLQANNGNRSGGGSEKASKEAEQKVSTWTDPVLSLIYLQRPKPCFSV